MLDHIAGKVAVLVFSLGKLTVWHDPRHQDPALRHAALRGEMITRGQQQGIGRSDDLILAGVAAEPLSLNVLSVIAPANAAPSSGVTTLSNKTT